MRLGRYWWHNWKRRAARDLRAEAEAQRIHDRDTLMAQLFPGAAK